MGILSDNINTDETENIPLHDVSVKVTISDVSGSRDKVIETDPLIDDETKEGLVMKVEAPKAQSRDIGKGTLTEHQISSSSGNELLIPEEDETMLTGPIFESDTEKLPAIKEDTSRKNEVDVNEIGSDIETDKVKVETKDSEKVSSKKAIEDTLRKHYKCLSFFGIRFTWLGIHMLYRLALVACRTFITEPVTRLYPMSALVLTMAVANAFIKPYKDQRANITATFSYIANLCIAGLNLVKANYVTFGCDTNCQFRDKVIQYMDTFDNVLLLYAPIAAIGLFVLYTVVQKILPKRK